MARLNRLEIIGRMGTDAVLRQAGGTPVLSFRVAVDGYKRDSDPTWFSVSVWGERGEKLDGLGLTKGTQVFIAGELSVRTYESGGETRASLEINARDIELLGSKPSGGGQRRQEPSGGRQRAPGADFPSDNFGDDDIPF